MEARMDIVKEAKRHTCTYSFAREPLSSLEGLVSLLVGANLKTFSDTYGHILALMETVIDPPALQTLLQFYDPELRCFTFQDYQLAPTLEEYSVLLGLKIKDQVPFIAVPKEVDFGFLSNALYLSPKDLSENWKTRNGSGGLPLKFLVRKAKEEAAKKNWDRFNTLLAVSIYGIVLFPSSLNFVDLAAICVFLGGNPVPTLLADTYFAIHSRHGKGGAINCCLQLLFQWYMSLLPTKGPFIETEKALKWTQRVMSLTSYDIQWHRYRFDVTRVIVSCGEFYNVPLVGTKGGINYNPILSLRQLGYVMKDRPLDVEVRETVYFEGEAEQAMLGRVTTAWLKINREDGAHLGKKNVVALAPYTDWVKKRVEKLLLPYDRMSPLQVQPPLVSSDCVSAELYRRAITENVQLREKEEKARIDCYLLDHDRARLAHQLREVKAGTSGVVKAKKRPRVDDTQGDASVNAEEHARVLRKAEEMSEELARLRKTKCQLRRLLQEERSKTVRELHLRQEAELELAKVRAENATLRSQLQEAREAPVITPLPPCMECDILVDHCRYLESRIAREDCF